MLERSSAPRWPSRRSSAHGSLSLHSYILISTNNSVFKRHTAKSKLLVQMSCSIKFWSPSTQCQLIWLYQSVHNPFKKTPNQQLKKDTNCLSDKVCLFQVTATVNEIFSCQALLMNSWIKCFVILHRINIRPICLQLPSRSSLPF